MKYVENPLQGVYVLINKVLDTIKRNDMFCYNERVLVGVSGGCDSVALLHVLANIPYALDIRVVHINHMLRGKDADLDEQCVKDHCAEMGIPFTSVRIDVESVAKSTKTSVEEAGRNVRYEVFFEQAHIQGCSKIAVAHHKDDQAETVLMRLMRGSGLKGLTGIPDIREDKRAAIIRPFIEVSRREIEDYCDKERLETRTDESNFDSKYLRNKVRNELIPLLGKEYNPSIVDALVRTQSLLKEDDDYLEKVARCEYDRCKQLDYFDISILKGLHMSILTRVLMEAYREFIGKSDYSYAEIMSIVELLRSGKMGASVDLQGGYIAIISYEGLSIEKRSGIEYEEKEITFDERISWGEGIISMETKECNFPCEPNAKMISGYLDMDASQMVKEWVVFDVDKLTFPLKVRQKAPGDRIRPFGMNETKLLSDVFVDEKISKNTRRGTPVIESNSEILWICGVKSSNVARVTADTKKLLILRCVNVH